MKKCSTEKKEEEKEGKKGEGGGREGGEEGQTAVLKKSFQASRLILNPFTFSPCNPLFRTQSRWSALAFNSFFSPKTGFLCVAPGCPVSRSVDHAGLEFIEILLADS